VAFCGSMDCLPPTEELPTVPITGRRFNIHLKDTHTRSHTHLHIVYHKHSHVLMNATLFLLSRQLLFAIPTIDVDGVLIGMHTHLHATARLGHLRVRAVLDLRPALVLEAEQVQIVEPAHVAHRFVESAEQHQVVTPYHHAVTRPKHIHIQSKNEDDKKDNCMRVFLKISSALSQIHVHDGFESEIGSGS
jgi:hypothetical protein